MRTQSETTRVSGDGATLAAPKNWAVLLRPTWLTLAVLGLCGVIYLPVASFAGTGLRAIFIVAAAFAGWQLGFWRGLAVAIIILPIIIGLTAIGGGDVAAIFSAGGAVGATVLVAAAATAGRLHDLDAARAAAEAALRAERDVAMQRQTEADRARAETRAVLDASGEVMVLVDTQRRFRLVNRSFEEILGIAPSDVIGRDWRELGALVARIFADPDGFTRLVSGTAADASSRFVTDVRQRWPVERDLELTTNPVGPVMNGSSEWGDGAVGRLYVLRDVTNDREVARLREQHRRLLEADLARAAKLQADLLPHGTPSVPAFDFAARCLPAHAVGGDFFDWQEPAPGMLTLTLGDVMGKGLSAALLMATVRAALEAVSAHSPPARALEAVASATERDLARAEAFVTLFHARVDSVCHVEYADAGHGYVFVQRADGAVEDLPARGLPLGIFPDQSYQDGALDLAPGEALVVYSDGLVDACPDRAHIAAQLKGAPNASSMVDRLVTLATSGTPLVDDLTIVVLRRPEAVCAK